MKIKKTSTTYMIEVEENAAKTAAVENLLQSFPCVLSVGYGDGEVKVEIAENHVSGYSALDVFRVVGEYGLLG